MYTRQFQKNVSFFIADENAIIESVSTIVCLYTRRCTEKNLVEIIGKFRLLEVTLRLEVWQKFLVLE